MNLAFPRLWIVLFLGFTFWVNAQFVVPKAPSIIYPVYDEVGMLSTQEKENINQKLIAFHDSTSVEILVAIIPTTHGEDINFAASQIGNAWKVGKKGKENGVVLLIAFEDRKISIQQGRDVERYLTAAVTGQIIDYLITPSFKKGNYSQGINAAVDAIMEAVQGKYEMKPSDKEEDISWVAVFLIFIGIIILLSLFGNNGGGTIITGSGRTRYGGGFGGFSGGFGGGSFGGGSSSGGFGGFGGGGSFGGGGASGGW
ncbi:TPM domain-containing protein [Bergeyella zoohelcum]|uniref:TPM domain-containing protein n=1 Tax=Bergeyella zoohelcum TaxID=1015 RepID=UPI002A917657|nr:TPM domain-containing protein [Bergeyella zoohelcum]MDY6026327.1 TPM domain-containing protein [Bergeyella zoohelcum]